MIRTSLKTAIFASLITALVSFSSSASACDKCIAQRKAQQQAAEGRMRHVGGSLGSGGYEGVGFSTRSAEDAIRNCCYWGNARRPPSASLADLTVGTLPCCIGNAFGVLFFVTQFFVRSKDRTKNLQDKK